MKFQNLNNQFWSKDQYIHPLQDKTDRLKNQENKQYQIKKNIECSQNITSVSTINKIGYDHSIDEFSRQILPSENDMSRSHLKHFPESPPFKSQAERNPLVQPRKHSYSVINDHSKVCIDKLEFKINKPNKENQLKNSLLILNREQVMSHSESDKMQINKIETTNNNQRENAQQYNNRRQTTQQIFQSNAQRITNSESPKKSCKNIKIFQNQISKKDSQTLINNYQSQQHMNSSQIANKSQLNNINAINNCNQRQFSNEIDNRRNKDNIVRKQQIFEKKDTTNLFNVAQKVIEIAKNQQDYLQNLSLQNISPIQKQQTYPPQIIYQQHLNSQLQNQQQFLQQQQFSQKQIQQYFKSNPIRNNTLQHIFVQQLSNFQPTKQQVQYIQQNQKPIFINTSLTPQNNPHHNLQLIQSQSLEFPSRFCSQGGNPYSQSNKRIFTDSSSREISPQFIKKANNIRLAQQKGQIEIIGCSKNQNSQIYEQNIPKNRNNSHIDMNTHIQNQKQIHLLNTGGCQVNYQKQEMDTNCSKSDQIKSSQGKMINSKNENRNQDAFSSQNSINNQTKFASFGIGGGTRFSFSKGSSQMEINSSQLQDNNTQKNKPQEKKLDQQKENKIPSDNKRKIIFNKTQDINQKQTYGSQQMNIKPTKENVVVREQTEKKEDNSNLKQQTNFSSDNKETTLNQYVDSSSQRKSYSSLGRNSLYSPIKNYYKQNTQGNILQKEQSNEDKLGITPVSMLNQQKRSLTIATPEDFQRIIAQKEKTGREVTADPIEIQPSQCDRRLSITNEYYTNMSQDNIKQPFRNTVHTFGNTHNSQGNIYSQQIDLNEKRKFSLNNQQMNVKSKIQNNSEVLNQNENLEAEISGSSQNNKKSMNSSSSSSKKFRLDKLKQIITSDLKNAQCNQYIDEYTLHKNKQLLEKHKMKRQRNNSTSIINTSDEVNNINLTYSVDKNQTLLKNIDNTRSSFSASRINTSFINSSEMNKTVNNQYLLTNQKYIPSQSTTPNRIFQTYIPHYYPIKDQNDISASSINQFTVNSFLSTPLNQTKDSCFDKQNNNREIKILKQESSVSKGKITKIFSAKKQKQKPIFKASNQQKDFQINRENTSSCLIISNNEANKQFQKNMLFSTQPIPKEPIEEIDSKRTYLESDRQTHPAQLVQTCQAYQLKYPNQYVNKQNQNGSIVNEVSNLFSQAQPILPHNKQEINNKISDQNGKNCFDTQLQNLQNYKQAIQSMHIEINQQGRDKYEAQKIFAQAQPNQNIFMRKQSTNELSRSFNSKNQLNQSMDLKRKSMFLPPKPQQNNLSLSNNYQNQSFDELKKQITCTQSAKNSRNPIFKNPKSIKDSIINGRHSFSQNTSSNEAKCIDLFTHSTHLTKLNITNKQNMLSKLSNNEIVCHNINAGERLNTFDDVSQFEIPNINTLSSTNQQISDNQQSTSIHYIQTNQSHSNNQQYEANQQYSTDKKYLCTTQASQDKYLNQRNLNIFTEPTIQEKSYDQLSKSSNFPLFTEFFSSIQQEYQKSIKENINGKYVQNQSCLIEQNSNPFSIKNYDQQNTGCFRENMDVSSKQNINQYLYEQVQQYPNSQEFQQNNSLNKFYLHNNMENQDIANQSKYANQDMKFIKQKLFHNGNNQQNQRINRDNFSQNQDINQNQYNNNSFNGNNIQNNKYIQNRCYQQETNKSLNNTLNRNIGQYNNYEQNSNNTSFKQKQQKLKQLNISSTSNNNNKSGSNVLLQYPSTSKSNTTTQQSNVVTNTQSYVTQSNVPTQQSLQNMSNASKFSDCTNSKLIQIFLSNQQLDQLTGNTNYLPNTLKGLSKQVNTDDSNNGQTQNQLSSQKQQQLIQQLQVKLIECNKNLEIIKVQTHQKLHNGERFSDSRLCLYINFFIESLNLIIINNQSSKELKNSLNDLTAIMEKIAVSTDEHQELFLQFAHKGYEIGLQKLGIIKRLN